MTQEELRAEVRETLEKSCVDDALRPLFIEKRMAQIKYIEVWSDGRRNIIWR